MPYCRVCGAEIEENSKFCTKCGAPITPEAEKAMPPHPSYRKARSACFGPPGSGRGIWGAISGGVFIIGVGILWYFDIWWPGILILIGLMIIIGGIVARR